LTDTTELADPQASPDKRPKVLRIEDSETNRFLVARRLERHGFDVRCAIDGPSGVAMAADENPDIILMDIALGEMNGWEATWLIKAAPCTAHIPIIALTAHDLGFGREKSIEFGCDDFDTKPVDLPRLLEKMHACLARAKSGPK
jgi:CheY-like chemotaxis protein